MTEIKEKEIEKILQSLSKVSLSPVRRAFLKEKILKEIRQEKRKSFLNLFRNFFARQNLVPISLATIMIFFGFFISAFNEKREAVATFASVNGSVFIESADGVQRPASAWSTLKIGDKVVVNKGSEAQIKFIDESVTSLTENTEIKIDSAMEDIEKSDKKLLSIDLKKGSIKTTKKKGSRSKLAVKTPHKIVSDSRDGQVIKAAPEEKKVIPKAIPEKKKTIAKDISSESESDLDQKNSNSSTEEKVSFNETEKNLSSESVSLDLTKENKDNSLGEKKDLRGLVSFEIDLDQIAKLDFDEFTIKAKIAKVKLEQAFYNILLLEDLDLYEKELLGYQERLLSICDVFAASNEKLNCLNDLNSYATHLEEREGTEDFLLVLGEITRLKNVLDAVYEKRASLKLAEENPGEVSPALVDINKLILKEEFLSDLEKKEISFIYTREIRKVSLNDLNNIEKKEVNIPALGKVNTFAFSEEKKKLAQETIDKIKLETEKREKFNLIETRLGEISISIKKKFDFSEDKITIFATAGYRIIFSRERVEENLNSFIRIADGFDLKSKELEYVDLSVPNKIVYR